jgi:hypothetical protein
MGLETCRANFWRVPFIAEQVCGIAAM